MLQYLRDAVVKAEDVASVNLLPPMRRLQDRRPVAMIECLQEIPCNSCAMACKNGAIRMDNVSDIPKLDFQKCTGCMACAMVCPGLAIFLLRVEEDCGYITLPYEFLLIPKVGDQVATLDREGKVLGKSRVIWVLAPQRNDGTALVTIQVPKKWLLEARAIRLGEE